MKHITADGKFRSDKFRVIRMADGEDVTDDKLVLSFKDEEAWEALVLYLHATHDVELQHDIAERLETLGMLREGALLPEDDDHED